MATGVMESKDTVEIKTEDIYQYLKIYNAPIDWAPHVQQLLIKKGPEQGKQQVAATILMPLYDRYVITKPPESLLFVCPSFNQYANKDDWMEELRTVIARDRKEEATRQEFIDLGIIFPIDYSPMCRQALNWLIDRAVSSGALNDKANRTDADKELIKKFENLVLTYGGAVICNIFIKDQYHNQIDKILNWRSGYFFERLIHHAYSAEEIRKIKTLEINKMKNADPKLVKYIKKIGA